MAPHIENIDVISAENDLKEFSTGKPSPREYKIIHIHVLFFAFLHLAGLYGLYLLFTSATWSSVVLTLILHELGMFGSTAGSHRLFSHKAFKATPALQWLLIICHSFTGQKSVMTWVWLHRVHHKYTDTDADPHNSNRGFFFSHIGWMMVQYHPDVMKMRKTIDISDVLANPIVMWQKRNASWFLFLMAFIIPTTGFWLLGEPLLDAWNINSFRLILSGHAIFTINSFAHAFGYRPYEKNINACNSWPTIIMTAGEGFHNFHHAFPNDYRASEFGNYWLNSSTAFIAFFAKIGWAYDLKTASDDTVKARLERTGDGSDLWGRKI